MEKKFLKYWAWRIRRKKIEVKNRSKEENDLTDEFIKMLNDKYTASTKKVEEKK